MFCCFCSNFFYWGWSQGSSNYFEWLVPCPGSVGVLALVKPPKLKVWSYSYLVNRFKHFSVLFFFFPPPYPSNSNWLNLWFVFVPIVSYYGNSSGFSPVLVIWWSVSVVYRRWPPGKSASLQIKWSACLLHQFVNLYLGIEKAAVVFSLITRTAELSPWFSYEFATITTCRMQLFLDLHSMTRRIFACSWCFVLCVVSLRISRESWIMSTLSNELMATTLLM